MACRGGTVGLDQCPAAAATATGQWEEGVGEGRHAAVSFQSNLFLVIWCSLHLPLSSSRTRDVRCVFIATRNVPKKN